MPCGSGREKAHIVLPPKIKLAGDWLIHVAGDPTSRLERF
jgi:hypothetical protein